MSEKHCVTIAQTDALAWLILEQSDTLVRSDLLLRSIVFA